MSIWIFAFGVFLLMYLPKSSITSKEGLNNTTTIYKNIGKKIPKTESNIDFSTRKSVVTGIRISENLLATSSDELKKILLENEEFIIYWLPKLEANKYNYIRFASSSEINANMPLEITPQPDSIIRIIMTFKGLDSPIEVHEQKIITPERKGFTVVEWGGVEI